MRSVQLSGGMHTPCRCYHAQVAAAGALTYAVCCAACCEQCVEHAAAVEDAHQLVTRSLAAAAAAAGSGSMKHASVQHENPQLAAHTCNFSTSTNSHQLHRQHCTLLIAAHIRARLHTMLLAKKAVMVLRDTISSPNVQPSSAGLAAPAAPCSCPSFVGHIFIQQTPLSVPTNTHVPPFPPCPTLKLFILLSSAAARSRQPSSTMPHKDRHPRTDTDTYRQTPKDRHRHLRTDSHQLHRQPLHTILPRNKGSWVVDKQHFHCQKSSHCQQGCTLSLLTAVLCRTL
jgi:hypothetical protein